jgi:hypothetical protein
MASNHWAQVLGGLAVTRNGAPKERGVESW